MTCMAGLGRRIRLVRIWGGHIHALHPLHVHAFRARHVVSHSPVVHRVPPIALGSRQGLCIERRGRGVAAAGQALADGAGQLGTRNPVVANRIEIACIGFVFLLLDRQRLERADEHEVEFEAGLRDHGFALGNEFGAIAFSQGLCGHQGGIAGFHFIAGVEFASRFLCLGQFQFGLGAGNPARSPVEQRNLPGQRRARQTRAIRLLLAGEADFDRPQPPGATFQSIGLGDGIGVLPGGDHIKATIEGETLQRWQGIFVGIRGRQSFGERPRALRGRKSHQTVQRAAGVP